MSVTAATDNKGNGFILDRLMSTKFPLYVVLMEVAAQLESSRVALSLAWRPRDENEEADALTNEVFAGFDPQLRVQVAWRDLKFQVLPRVLDLALSHFRALSAAKREARTTALASKRRRESVPLREREPW